MEPHDEIEDVLPPDALFWAMEPFGPPMGEASCSTWDPKRFPSQQEQQAAFDGESTMPERDLPQARAMCRTCLLLESCRRYALDSRDEHVFLAGETAEERRKKWRKSGEITKRRRRVDALYALRVPTVTMAQLLQRDESSIRSDLRELEKRRPDLPPTA
ncbi:WhiB family transcriptional regulator [Streptomyces sp. NBC_01445]|uniref:WhiB family transcriptional regulator n=1 Tax=Streptomyces sp. NBC_01445 TaxID=2903869 RepID=UPI002DD839F5|nr:WhiB family transcriptional regulator [Streptomyces sp. NBC_01445]WSE03837.1 WhiB family transcriptional regulator [Streptomyces sp. NBC_01445]